MEYALLLEEHRNVVCRFDIVHGQNLRGFDLTKHGDFVDRGINETVLASAGNLSDG